ncbi:MAG: nucleotidyl transferase AbiEii/AbiGii toxin family protein [Aestuariivita sp.]|nr:nucleotidyl transferase AbiEii/AbiGii toxin family protein [Aestuariivita sp.]MCY4201122.1 nucleotidyl transferase AbiEii/AbiGii toxin family protein [Aestuariivita sp.]MCY4288309.1 nucleotidyl transferase AbiEii/AbiGii toxin family protein [Aestuariivita sp.]MCY4345953.1 nucleotidyl transferase AbiEii/AbiGii toxin family protein [Aestuariivita sp.]
MIRNDNVLLLPDPLQEAFACAVEVFKQLSEGRIKEADLRFGGGTALALIWNHRQSTDLDFAIDHGVFDRLFPNNDLQASTARLTAIRDRQTNHTVAITAPSVGIPVSFARSRLSDRRHEDIVLPFHIAHSAIHLVHPSFILFFKERFKAV